MVIGIANLIKEYARTEERVKKLPMPGTLNQLNAALMRCFTGIDWEEVTKLKEGRRLLAGRTSRHVYVWRELGVVVKPTCSLFDYDKGRPSFPYAEELASDICQLFGWQEIPKTNIIHQTEISNYPKFYDLFYCFLPEDTSFTITFIIQHLAPGRTLPFEIEQWYEWDKEERRLSLPSYQRAFLLALLLGKEDALGCNSILDPATGRFYEIDNECIGANFYQPDGALHHFTHLKLKPLSKEVLDDFLKVKPETLYELIEKTKNQNLHLASLWEKEKPPKKYSGLQKKLDHFQNKLTYRLSIMQKTCHILLKAEETITLKQFEDAFEDQYQVREHVISLRERIAYTDAQHLKKYLEKSNT